MYNIICYHSYFKTALWNSLLPFAKLHDLLWLRVVDTEDLLLGADVYVYDLWSMIYDEYTTLLVLVLDDGMQKGGNTNRATS